VFDLLLTGGQIVDGLGSPPYPGDVGVKDGRISAVGSLGQAEAAQVIDCSGRCISPGWVDIHGHADSTVLGHPIGLNLLVQGCTLTVAGNCGGSAAPVSGRAAAMLTSGEQRGVGATLQAMCRHHPDATWSMGDFLDEVERAKPGVNYVQLVGHNALRRSVMGHDPRRATEDEVKQMAGLRERSLDEGVYGMSSGLVFIPGCWSDTSEVIELARIVAQYDGVYTSHIRGERETNIEATQEFIEIAEPAGVRAQMSHMQSKWPVYGNAVMKIEMLEQALSRGVDVACDSEAFANWASTAARFLQIYRYSADELVLLMGSLERRAQLKHTMRTIHPWHPLGKFGPRGRRLPPGLGQDTHPRLPPRPPPGGQDRSGGRGGARG